MNECNSKVLRVKSGIISINVIIFFVALLGAIGSFMMLVRYSGEDNTFGWSFGLCFTSSLLIFLAIILAVLEKCVDCIKAIVH